MRHPNKHASRLAALALATALCTGPAWSAPPPPLSEHGSVGLSVATLVSTTEVSVETLTSIPELSVTGVEVSAAGAVWLVTGMAKGSGEAIEFSVKVSGGASMAVGTTLEVVSGTAGSLLMASGQAVAFIPNALGAALFYSETWDEDRERGP